MSIYLDLYLISVIVVCVTDIGGFFNAVEAQLARWLGVKEIHLKLLECTFCQTWWCCFFWLLINAQLCLPTITASLLIACVTEQTQWLILNVKDLLQYTIDLTQKITNR